MKFVAIGECMVEMAPIENSSTFQKSYAGDTFNTAWYLKKLAPEWVISYVTRLGTDQLSDAMIEMMDDAGVETGSIQRDLERTAGLYMVSLENGERSFSYWRETSAARKLAQDIEVLQHAIQDADTVYFSGITLAILGSAGRDNLLKVLKDAKNAGKSIVFDPNLRPRLWANNDEMKSCIMQGAAVSDVILPSFDDEAVYFGDADIHATLDRYLATGADTVVVKNGAGEMICSYKGKKVQITPPATDQIVDTTAAGDSFNAGFLAGLPNCDSLDKALLTASRVAAHVIAQRGALVPIDTSMLLAKDEPS